MSEVYDTCLNLRRNYKSVDGVDQFQVVWNGVCFALWLKMPYLKGDVGPNIIRLFRTIADVPFEYETINKYEKYVSCDFDAFREHITQLDSSNTSRTADKLVKNEIAEIRKACLYANDAERVRYLILNGHDFADPVEGFLHSFRSGCKDMMCYYQDQLDPPELQKAIRNVLLDDFKFGCVIPTETYRWLLDFYESFVPRTSSDWDKIRLHIQAAHSRGLVFYSQMYRDYDKSFTLPNGESFYVYEDPHAFNEQSIESWRIVPSDDYMTVMLPIYNENGRVLKQLAYPTW